MAEEIVSNNFPELALDDIQVPDLDIYGFSREEAMRIPEMDAGMMLISFYINKYLHDGASTLDIFI